MWIVWILTFHIYEPGILHFGQARASSITVGLVDRARRFFIGAGLFEFLSVFFNHLEQLALLL